MNLIGANEHCVIFEKLVAKLLQTIGTIEQFQGLFSSLEYVLIILIVRITNLSGIITSGNGSSLASYQSALLSGSGANAALFSTTLRGAQVCIY